MPQQNFEFDDDDDEFEDEQPQGSDLLRQLRKQLKEAQKLNKQLADEKATLAKSVRERTVADALTAKGLNPKIARLIPADIEQTPDALNAWLDDNADVFGIKPAEQAVPEAETVQEAAVHNRMASVENTAVPAGTEALLQQISAASNEKDLLALIGRQGG